MSLPTIWLLYLKLNPFYAIILSWYVIRLLFLYLINIFLAHIAIQFYWNIYISNKNTLDYVTRKCSSIGFDRVTTVECLGVIKHLNNTKIDINTFHFAFLTNPCPSLIYIHINIYQLQNSMWQLLDIIWLLLIQFGNSNP